MFQTDTSAASGRGREVLRYRFRTSVIHAWEVRVFLGDRESPQPLTDSKVVRAGVTETTFS